MITEDGKLVIFVIYGPNNIEHPGSYLIRRQVPEANKVTILDSPEPYAIGSTLMRMRASIPPGNVCLPRHPEDDPCIVECWV